MPKYSSVAVIAGVLALAPIPTLPASAAQGVIFPGNDSLDFTPPIDLTEQQIQAAPRRDRRKVRAIQKGSYRPMRHRTRRLPVLPARGQ